MAALTVCNLNLDAFANTNALCCLKLPILLLWASPWVGKPPPLRSFEKSTVSTFLAGL